MQAGCGPLQPEFGFDIMPGIVYDLFQILD
jgi:hypothetical protein